LPPCPHTPCVFIEKLYSKIVSSLIEDSVAHTPRKSGDFCKFWWDDNLQDLKAKLIDAHNYDNFWVSSAYPTSDPCLML
jgi:hypothetical protein